MEDIGSDWEDEVIARQTGKWGIRHQGKKMQEELEASLEQAAAEEERLKMKETKTQKERLRKLKLEEKEEKILVRL